VTIITYSSSSSGIAIFPSHYCASMCSSIKQEEEEEEKKRKAEYNMMIHNIKRPLEVEEPSLSKGSTR